MIKSLFIGIFIFKKIQEKSPSFLGLLHTEKKEKRREEGFLSKISELHNTNKIEFTTRERD